LKHTKITLSTRPFIEPGVDDVAAARDLFRYLITLHAPQVLMRLASLVLPHLADRENCERALSRWAKHSHLTKDDKLPHWMLVRPTLGWWGRCQDPRIVGKVWFSAGESQPKQRAEALIKERLKPILEARAAKRPEPPMLYPGERGKESKWVEPPKSYEARMRRDIAALGWVAAPTVTLEHFQWAVRFQCGRERIQIIAGRAGAHPRAVEKAVKHVLALIGLDRRVEKHGPLRRDDLKNW
jgi:hypothetical protein